MFQITLLDFIIFTLAAYRVTHLLVYDVIFEPVRKFFVVRYFDGWPYPSYTLQGGRLRSFIGRLLLCHWCAGIWVAGIMALLYWTAPAIVEWIFVALAAAAVLSFIETAWTKVVGYPELKERK